MNLAKCRLNVNTNLFIILVLLKKEITLLRFFNKLIHQDEITSTTTGFLGLPNAAAGPMEKDIHPFFRRN